MSPQPQADAVALCFLLGSQRPQTLHTLPSFLPVPVISYIESPERPAPSAFSAQAGTYSTPVLKET